MKVVFVFERLNQNKWYAPLIEEALARGLAVECWLDHRDISKTTKAYERPERSSMPRFRSGEPTYETYVGADGLLAKLERSGPGIVFMDRPPSAPKTNGQVWAHVVTSYYDSFAGIPPAEMKRFDLIFATTIHWLEKSLQFYVMTRKADDGSRDLLELRERTHATGVPQFDHFALLTRESARKHLGIPPDRKVVTVYAFEPGCTFWATCLFQVPSLLRRLLLILGLPFTYPRFFTKVGRSKLLSLCWQAIVEKPKFFRAAFREPTDLDVLRAIRSFCDRNSCFFILKYRKKYPPLLYQLGIADLELFEDNDYYPYTSAIVIAASDLLFTCFSTAVGEAAFSGVPVINLHPDEMQELQLADQFRLIYKGDTSHLARAYYECVHDLGGDAFYNTPGVVNDMTFRELCTRAGEIGLEDFRLDSRKRADYVRKYVQDADGPAAPRILDLAIQRANQGKERA